MNAHLLFVACVLLSVDVANAQPTIVQPAPVRPSVMESTAYSNLVATVRLTQDRCYAWSAPEVAQSGNTFAITQTVAARPECPATGSEFRDVELGRLPAGAYRLTYTPTVVGAPVFADYAFDFDVHAREPGDFPAIRFEPAYPVALEPVTAIVELDVCDMVKGFRLNDDALEIDTSHADGWCDYEIPRAVEIGSFPPGTYLLRVVRDGNILLEQRSFTVGPSRAPPARNEYSQDLSGLWVSPDEEPGTAIAFIDSSDPQADGFVYNGLTGVWYRYDAAGQPVWYYLETNNAIGNGTFTGFAYRYAATNPGALPFQRTVAGTRRGEVAIQVDNVSGDLRLRGVVDGETIDIAFRPFRWTRNAWSDGN